MRKDNYSAELFRLKYQKSTKGESVAHAHTGIELHYCEVGEGKFRVSHMEKTMTPGKITLLFAPMFHHVSSDARRNYSRTVLHIPQKLVSNAIRFIGLDNSDLLPTKRHPIVQLSPLTNDHSDIQRVFRLINREVRREWSPINPAVTLHVAELLYTIDRSVQPGQSSFQQFSPHDEQIVDAVRVIVQDHPMGNVSVDELAEHVGLSRGHLWRIFNRVTGMSPRNFLFETKMERAKEQLLAGKLVSEVATACMYSDVASFSRAFKGYAGLSPSRFVRSRR